MRQYKRPRLRVTFCIGGGAGGNPPQPGLQARLARPARSMLHATPALPRVPRDRFSRSITNKKGHACA